MDLNNIDPEQLIGTALYIAAVVLITILIVSILRRVQKKQEEVNGAKIHIKFFFSMLELLIFLIAFASIGSEFDGFQSAVKTILASSGIIALGLSMAAQESLSNIIDGIFISMFRPFNIGDRVTLPEKNNLTGFVSAMNLRHTVITTFNKTAFIVPNSVMSSAIINNSNFTNEPVAYPIDVTVSYESDLALAMQLVKKAVEENEFFTDPRTEEQKTAGEPMTRVLVRDFGDSGIALRCQMYTKDVNISFRACSEARYMIKKLFDENGIVIPYNTIHIDNPETQKSYTPGDTKLDKTDLK